jgi:hypothetical protein
MIWRAPKMWEGGECWIIGGGPSIPYQFGIPDEVIQKVLRKEDIPHVYSPYLSPIHNKHVIGINMAYKLGTWMDIVFFGDSGFYLQNRKELATFPGLKVSCNPRVNNPVYAEEGVKFVQRDNRKARGISTRPGFVSWNGNSGAAAISLAVQLGVKRIILLGFDMDIGPNDNQHWHSLYTSANRKNKTPRKLPFNRHMQGFRFIKKDAKDLGITIINASPNSVITEFTKRTVNELLNETEEIKEIPLVG